MENNANISFISKAKKLPTHYNKGIWTKEEDIKLKSFVRIHGDKDFINCKFFISNRSPKQCRDRWFNNLHPNLIKGSWALEEDYLLFKLFFLYGGKWIYFILLFNKRSECNLKNRFYSTLRRFARDLKSRGIITETRNQIIEMIIAEIEDQLVSKYNFSSKEQLNIFTYKAYSLNRVKRSYDNPRDYFAKQENEYIVGYITNTISLDEITQIIKLCQFFRCNLNTLDKIILPRLINCKYE